MRAGIALGSNLGDRLANLRQACSHLLNRFGPLLRSGIYQTDPVGCAPGTAAYLNAVVELEYSGDPLLLLDQLQAIEALMGRPSRRPRNAPRTIDLDILYLGPLTLATDQITLPHPRLHLRRFVLAPLSDIRPDLVLPGRNETVVQLLAALPPQPAAEPFPEGL